MLEKIGLTAKPSLRGNTWVVHCQGCTFQFTLINRQHHCRRCSVTSFASFVLQPHAFFAELWQFEVESKPEDEVLNQSESENS